MVLRTSSENQEYITWVLLAKSAMGSPYHSEGRGICCMLMVISGRLKIGIRSKIFRMSKLVKFKASTPKNVVLKDYIAGRETLLTAGLFLPLIASNESVFNATSSRVA